MVKVLKFSIGGMGADFKARGGLIHFMTTWLGRSTSLMESCGIKTVEMYQKWIWWTLCPLQPPVNTLTSQMRVEQMLPIADLDQMKRIQLQLDFWTGNQPKSLWAVAASSLQSSVYWLLSMLRQLKMLRCMTAMQTATDTAGCLHWFPDTQEANSKEWRLHKKLVNVAGASALE